MTFAAADLLLLGLLAVLVSAAMLLLLVFWLTLKLIAGLLRLITWPIRAAFAPADSPRVLVEETVAGCCPDHRCRVANPPNAFYCRRCGRLLRPVPAGRVLA